ncbi:hypothetical protein ACF0H5_021831 [Mactra antiquata]
MIGTTLSYELLNSEVEPFLKHNSSEHYRIPEDADLSTFNELSLFKIYLKYVNTLQMLCKEVIRVGSHRDGGKEICVEEQYKPRQPCLVYSIGINNQLDFDMAVVAKFGCDVHCFDPSMKNETHRVSKHIWFYKFGLGGTNHINNLGWELKTLDTIRRELGHTHRTIDILKIDAEGAEWLAIPQMISSGALDDIRQISMETHFGYKAVNKVGGYWGDIHPVKQVSALRQLYDFGYRTVMRERNMYSLGKWPGFRKQETNVYELTFIKPPTKQLVKKNPLMQDLNMKIRVSK